MPAGTPLGAIDHAWLRMEHPTNPMMITGVLAFDHAPDIARLRQTLEQRLLPFRRFRQLVRPGGLGRRARWVDDPDFDIAAHLEERELPQPADRATLRREIGRLVSTALPRDRPLWKMHLLVNPRDGRAILLCRLHHCIADGFALMHVMLTLTDTNASEHGAPPPPPQKERSLKARLRAAVGAAVHGRVLHPREALRRSADVAKDLVHLATLRNQPDTLLRGPLGAEKRAAWSAPVPLAKIKRIGRAHGGTVNDVLMSAVAGALSRYLRERGEDPAGLELRTAIPVNLRSTEDMRGLGNHFGLVFLELPLHVADPRARFVELKRRMDALKRSPEPLVLLQLMRVMGAGPAWAEGLVVRILGAKTSAVLTNVPGPREPRYLAGQEIKTIMFWVPQSGRVGLGISIFSYEGEVRLGLSVDAHLVPDPDHILDAFPAEIDALEAAAPVRHTPERA